MNWVDVLRKKVLSSVVGLGLIVLSGCNGMPMMGAKETKPEVQTAQAMQQQAPVLMSTGPKKRVAVLPLATKTVVQALPAAGQTAAEMLTTALFKTNNFIVVERDLLDKVMREQGLGLTGAVDPNTAVKLGQILGVQAIITGSITQLGFSGQRTAIAGVQVGGKNAEAAMDVRAIDTTTAQLLLADTGTGKANTQAVAFSGYGQATDAQESKLLGDALRQASEDMARKLAAQMQQVPWAGRIAQVDGRSIYINAGADLGLKAGTQVNIYRPGKEIIDPATRQILGRQETQIGQLLITDVKERFSLAAISNGVGFQTNDIVRLSQ